MTRSSVWGRRRTPTDPQSTIGTDPSQYGDWAEYWANIVRAMRAVPGAHFLFDWTVNQYYRPIPFDQWYPGNDVVDIIGIDAYDSGITDSSLTPDERWQKLSNEPDGLNALAAFAAAHNKPMSIPEWGLMQVGPKGGAGDDPTYVKGLASFIATHPVVYNSYFLKPVGNAVIPLTSAPLSLAAYRSTLALNGGLNKPIVGMAATPDGGGYWLVGSDGGIFSFGDAQFYGSTGGIHLNQPIVGMAATPDGEGCWLVGSDGGIFSFGDAQFYGSTGGIHLNQPIVGMTATPQGNGYWLVGSDGGIFSFGDAQFHGSTGGIHLNQPIVGMTAAPHGNGYWLVGSDGGIFSFGDAQFHGSTGGIHLNQPIVGMTAAPHGNGYWLVGSDGGIFSFGDAQFHGSTGGIHLNQPIVGMTATPHGNGYWLVAADGGIFAWGDADFYGSE